LYIKIKKMKKLDYLKFLFLLLTCFVRGTFGLAQQSTSLNISSVQLPDLTTCAMTPGTFVLRVSNVTAAPITGVVVRDSLPPGVNYVSGSVSGTGVTFGTTVSANIVTFNLASVPASGFVDITFQARASCAVSTIAANIKNTYTASWGSLYTAPFVTANYGMLFPSVSITPAQTGTISANCLTPFVRDITICNGGFGALDSLVFSDVYSNSSLIVKGFSNGIATGLGTNNARTVLTAADFATIGNGDGKLDQNECLVLHDTVMAVGSTSPINGTLTATWGCYGSNCSNPSSNTANTVTSINASSPLQPALTRTLYALGDPDTPGQIYTRVNKYMELVKNNSQVTAVNTTIIPSVYGLKYIDTATIWVTKNGGTPYRPPMSRLTGIPWAWNTGTPADYAQSLTTFPNSNKWNNAMLSLGDLAPGDSVVVTFEVRTAGPLTRVSSSEFDHCFSESFCGGCMRGIYGPALSGASDNRISWQGCPSGTFTGCAMAFPQKIYNGLDTVQRSEFNPTSGSGHLLAEFHAPGVFIDSTNTDGRKCAYFENDTIRTLLRMDVMDLPFYTDKSSFAIRIYTNGGVKWDGKLNRTFGRLSTWSNNPWYADMVLDNTAIDSTITVYFKRSNCPVPDFRTKDVYNCYRRGAWQLSIGFVNQCPGLAQRRVRMTRIYDIDTTNNEPAIESGATTFPATWIWNSQCASACTDGVSILNYGHQRTTFDAPDNNQDGLPDASGNIDLNQVAINRITWGDTLQLKYKLVVHTTNVAGIPSLFVNSSINYSDTNSANACNAFLTKEAPQVVIRRPGVGTYSGTGTSTPVSTGRTFRTNISLQGTGGLNIPGLLTYMDGDTVELTQNVIYYKPHFGWGDMVWSFQHIPGISQTVNPTTTQLLKCDSVVCDFHTIDMNRSFSTTRLAGPATCSDSVAVRYILSSQIQASSCGTNWFPYESRNVYAPTLLKINIPASSNFTPTAVRLTWVRIIKGSPQCVSSINNQLLPASAYTFVNDTLIVDLKQIPANYGFNYRQINLYSAFNVDVTTKYTNPSTTCTRDHTQPSTTFPVVWNFEHMRPMLDTLNLNANTVTGTGTTLFWPGVNNCQPVLYAGSTANVTSNKAIIPVRYTVNNPQAFGTIDNNWMYIPNTSGIIVDSVKIKSTGAIVPMSAPGSYIFQLGNLGANGTTKDYDIYTHIVQCAGSLNLDIYADRTPCMGYPTSWANYNCKANANKSIYTLNTFAGELQMSDSLFTTTKDICNDDTVQFYIVNSQTQDANAVKVSFELPNGMSLIPGRTQLQYGNGAFVNTTDPILSAGVYSWTMPATDTLRKISMTPANKMKLRVVITTSCGYTSGSMIHSRVAGNVACGPVTSLFNTDPPPLNIVGAPSLSYLTNPKMSVTQISDCGSGSNGVMRIVLPISGGATLSGDSVKVKLPAAYNFVSYSSATTGSHNAPATNPTVSTDGTGKQTIGWQYAAGIPAGDSIVFYMQYTESAGVNHCTIDSERVATINTYIGGNLWCARDNMMCVISTINGADTSTPLITLRPSLSADIDTIRFNTGCTPQGTNCNPHSKLKMSGMLTNSGTADVASGTPVIMEVFMDMDNSGSINAGDKQYASLNYTGGLAAGQSISIDYYDTMQANCAACVSKNVLLRFANNPSQPVGQSQCLCDMVSTSTIQNSEILPLPLSITWFEAAQQVCNTAVVRWTAQDEAGGNMKYRIELGENGKTYNTVATVKGQNLRLASYEQLIDLPYKDNYIRIAQVEDGGIYYSKTTRLANTCDHSNNNIEVYPNPYGTEHNTLYVKLNESQSGKVQISVLDAIGKQHMSMHIEAIKGVKEYELHGFGALASGMYTLQVKNADGIIEYVKVIKD
jgi:uncharacterized repeat protein (TIGR01451 family)